MATEQTARLGVPVFEARFGDKDGALALLCAPAAMKDLFRHLADKTDLPDSAPAGVAWSPFVRGWPEGQYYILTLTSPDTKATRPGMVATRVFALPLSSVAECGDLAPLLELLQAAESEYIPERSLPLPGSLNESAPLSPLAACIASRLLGDGPIVAVVGQDVFEAALVEVWRQLPGQLRQSFIFGFSFSPADLKHSRANVVAVPAACSSRWRAYANCCSAETPVAESESAHALLSGRNYGEFEAFISGLGLYIKSFSDFRSYYRLYGEWKTRHASSAEGIYALLRSLGSMISSPALAVEQKQEALDIALPWIEKAGYEGILAQRSVKAAAFPGRASTLRLAIVKWIRKQVNEGSISAVQALKRVIAAIPTSQSADWQDWVRNGLSEAFTPLSSSAATTVWALLIHQESFTEVTIQVPETAEAESTLCAVMPAELSAGGDRVVVWAENRAWLTMMGIAILMRTSFEASIAALMSKPESSRREAAIARVCAGQPPKAIWAAASTYDSDALIDKAVEVAFAEPSVWTELDIGIVRWLKFVDRGATKSPRFLLKTNTGAVARKIFDAIRDGHSTTSAIWQALENADLLDLSDYPDRPQIWPRLPQLWRDRARQRTTRAWLQRFYAAQPPSKLELEPELVEVIFKTTSAAMAFPVESTRLGENGLCLIRAWGKEHDCEHWLDALARNNQKSPPNYTGEAGQLILENRWHDAMGKAKYYDENEKHHYLWPIWRPLYNTLGILERLSVKYYQGSFHPSQSKQSAVQRSVTVVFITALQEEFAAVTKQLVDKQEHVEKGTIYEIGKLRLTPEVECDAAVVQVGMGNALSAAATERAIAFLQPAFAFFVGIAGGLRDELAVGDVVAADKIYGYEGGKADIEFKPRPEATNVSHEALQRAHAVARDGRWLARITPTPKRPPQALVKPIVSGEKVLTSETAEEMKRIRKIYTDAHAVAMEEHGFGVALRPHTNVCFAVVRGISDVIENKAEADRAGSHDIAARHSVAFACEMLAGLLSARSMDR